MFGIGDIIVTSVDATEPRAVLRNVKHPEQVYEILRRAMLGGARRSITSSSSRRCERLN